MATASHFNQWSQVTDKEGTSHFQGIALTNSELNNYQDSTTVAVGGGQPVYDNKENSDHLINVKEEETGGSNTTLTK